MEISKNIQKRKEETKKKKKKGEFQKAAQKPFFLDKITITKNRMKTYFSQREEIFFFSTIFSNKVRRGRKTLFLVEFQQG